MTAKESCKAALMILEPMKVSNMREILVLILLCPLLLLLSSCSVGPDYERPETTLPEQFSNILPAKSQQPQFSDIVNWWKTFNDPVLNQLVEEAVASNLDLDLAQGRVREARALVAFSRSDFFPRVVTQAQYSRSDSSDNANFSSNNGNNDGSEVSEGRDNGIKDLYEAGFDAAWEIDIFGGTRRAVESAQANYQAQLESRRDVLVSLLAEVAQNYITLRGIQQELDITKSNVAAQKELLELQQMRFSAGLTSDLSVAQAEALLLATSSQVPSLSKTLKQTLHRLSVLLAQAPGSLNERLSAMASLPVGPTTIPAGLPADLLRRRPDVRQAEQELMAATANIGVATADLFPRLNLLGLIGFRSEMTSNFSNSASRYWSAGPNVSWDILSWFAVLDNIEVQDARQEQALALYKKTVLQALEDVENSLVAYELEQNRNATLALSVAANRRTLELATQLNRAGVVDFLNVLNAQQAVFDSEDQLVQSSRAVSGNLVALFKALGGGWEEFEQQSPQ